MTLADTSAHTPPNESPAAPLYRVRRSDRGLLHSGGYTPCGSPARRLLSPWRPARPDRLRRVRSESAWQARASWHPALAFLCLRGRRYYACAKPVSSLPPYSGLAGAGPQPHGLLGGPRASLTLARLQALCTAGEHWELAERAGVRGEQVAADLSRKGAARQVRETTQQRGLRLDPSASHADCATHGDSDIPSRPPGPCAGDAQRGRRGRLGQAMLVLAMTSPESRPGVVALQMGKRMLT
jgi:hypothetical protein